MSVFGEVKECHHCGMYHTGVCSRIKSIEYYPDGTTKKVEYHDNANPNSNPANGSPSVGPLPPTQWDPVVPIQPPWVGDRPLWVD